MPTAADVLTWQSMTAAVNEMKSPNQFLRSLLFGGADDPQHTESIEISIINNGRKVAPFVRKNGEAVMVGGYSETFQTVEPTNIRIKRPMKASDLMFQRRAGTVVFVTPQSQVQAMQQVVARELQVMEDMIVNAEEWLVAQSIQGTISYSVSDQEVFTITMPKPSGHNITLSVFWDDATPANVKINNNFHTAKQLISDAVGMGCTDVILGSEAATAFRNLVSGGHVKTLDLSNVDSGTITFIRQFTAAGAISLGSFDGIRIWEYSRTADVEGVATPMIRPKYAEFFAIGPAAQRVMYYGAIADMKALQGRNFVGRRFSKSWEVEDPSARFSLLASRPLPVNRRPGASVSMKVVSG